jgi:hypothetical protein
METEKEDKMKSARIVNIVPRYNDPEKKDYNHVGTMLIFGAKQDDGSYKDLEDAQIKALCKMIKIEILGNKYPVFLNEKRSSEDTGRNEFPNLD